MTTIAQTNYEEEAYLPCTCGHYRGWHSDTNLDDRLGPCTKHNCPCQRFTRRDDTPPPTGKDTP